MNRIDGRSAAKQVLGTDSDSLPSGQEASPVSELSRGDVALVSIRDEWGDDPQRVSSRIGRFQGLKGEGNCAEFDSFSTPVSSIDSLTVLKPGDKLNLLVRNPWGHDPNFVVDEVGFYNGRNEQGVLDLKSLSVPDHLILDVKLMTAEGSDPSRS